MVVYSQRRTKSRLAKIYRTIWKSPTPEERGGKRLEATLNGFDYNAGTA